MNALEVLNPSGSAPALPVTPVAAIGIDLGTTNSTVARVEWSPTGSESPVAKCLEVEQPTSTGPYINVLVPSVVAIHDGAVYVGEGAKRLRALSGLRRNKDIFYDCKNDMGALRTYHLAPEGFRSPVGIAEKVLSFLRRAAMEGNPQVPARVVVTVPASFQASQRADTLKAARAAGMETVGGDLLDEPVAAFLDYFVTHQDQIRAASPGNSNLLVFDFGGGTCDVAVFRFNPKGGSGRCEISPLSVSRYHRLGGGDIDTAIVHQVLIPQLIAQENLSPNDLAFDDRKLHIEPALLSVAEALKVGLCIEIARLQGFGKFDGADKRAILKSQPGSYPCPCPSRNLSLKSPTLTAAQLEAVLQPFLDAEILVARETEYENTCSVFAPIEDALDRAGIRPRDINLCLLVGGSSLIPQIKASLSRYFSAGTVLAYEDRESTQVAVARGAAYHALSLSLFKRPLIQPVAADEISIRTASGLSPIIPRAAKLPCPAPGQQGENMALVVPATAITGVVALRIELVAGPEARPIYVGCWDIPAPVNRGDPLRLRFSYDENQVLNLELSLLNKPGAEPLSLKLENPVTNIVNPHSTKVRIDTVEESLRCGKIPGHEVVSTLRRLAGDYAELGQTDKAIYYLQQALRRHGRPDSGILNALGIQYGKKQDWERQDKMYREAFAAEPDEPSPLFNLALSQLRRGKAEDADATIQRALALEHSGPYLVLAAQIHDKLGRADLCKRALDQAFALFGGFASMDDWELGWFAAAAHMAKDHARSQQAEAERIQRKRQKPDAGGDGLLPEVAMGIQKP